MKKICLMLTGAFLLAGAVIPEAQALPGPGRCDKPDYTRTDIDVATVKINQSDKIGTIYPLSHSVTQGGLGAFYCNGNYPTPGTLLNSFYISSRFASAMNYLGGNNFDVGIPGLALRIYTPDGYQSMKVPPYSAPYAHYNYTGMSRYYTSRSTPMRFYLVKTAATVVLPAGVTTVKMGTHDIPATAVYNYIGGSTDYLSEGPVSTWYLHLKFIEEVPTCAFQSETVTFPLGDVAQSSLPSVGSTSPWVTRSLVSAGCTAVKKVHMTFQGTADSDNRSLFAVEGGAQGIGVELKSYDDVAAVPDNSTRMSWNPRAAGQSYDFKARYKRTKPQMTAGDANAAITVNLTYD